YRLSFVQAGYHISSCKWTTVMKRCQTQAELPEAVRGIRLPGNCQQGTNMALGIDLRKSLKRHRRQPVAIVGIVLVGDRIQAHYFVLQDNARGPTISRT